MSLLPQLKKLFFSLALTLFVGVIFSAPVVNAYSMGDLGEDINDLFSSGEQGLSFTQYEGTLAELSKEGLNPTLVDSENLREFIIKIVNFALGFLGLIAVIIVIYGGVLYVTAAGEEERTQTGKKAITYAVIGLLIILGSYAFVNTIIRGATGGSDTTGDTFEASGAAKSGSSSNSAAEEVRVLGRRIYDGFSFLANRTEDLKSIQNDAEKESLLPSNFPSKNDVLNFLHSVESKLNIMKSQIARFSVAEATINDILRDIEKEIDSIDRLNIKKYAKLEEGTVSYCDVGEERNFGEGLEGASDREICANSDYNNYYTEGLYEAWEPLHTEYTTGNSLNDLAQPIAQDYSNQLQEIFLELDSIFNRFSNVAAIQGENSRTALAYGALKNAYGYSISNDQVNALSSGLLNSINTWNVDSSISDVGTDLLAGLNQQSIIYKELLNLEFVRARLNADVAEGSAPLAIIFNTSGSSDPAGGSIQGENITWDLAGTLATYEFITAPRGEVIPALDNSVDCTFATQAGREEEDFIGTTSKRCIYNKPGTYFAAIKIESNEPTKYAPGISVLRIIVNPPTNKIDLTLEAGGRTQTVMRYIDEVLVTDANTVTVTQSDAQAGITFDASATDAEQFRWNFGDGDVVEFSSSALQEHEYEEPGIYEVTLEVLNALGNQSKKIFRLEVSAIAARLTANPPSSAFINREVTFDASDSKSDLGNIVNYSWQIVPSAGQNIPAEVQQELDLIYPLEDSGGNLKILKHEFKYPINYDITVKVTDDARNDDDFTISGYRVLSQPPVALFDSLIPNPSQPATVHFDAETSYDPDGEENFNYQWEINPATGWIIVDPANNGLNSKKPIVKFQEKGDYEVSLKVTDKIAVAESDEISQTVTIQNVLDIAWADTQQVTYVLEDNGTAEVNFDLVSETAIDYEIDFGDGQSLSGSFSEDISHVYSEGGRYLVQVTVFDEEYNENKLQGPILISGGDKPIARIKLFVNDVEIQDLSDPVKVSKTDILTFDASDSKNIDGSGRNLKYSWNFGDGRNNSKKAVDHSYNEISPRDPGYFTVELTVTDENDVTKKDTHEIQIDVINIPPRFASVQGVVATPASELITPVLTNVRAYGVQDPDGEIVKYKWWYFDVTDPEEPLGIQITSTDSAQLVIGTKGAQGQKQTYGFGLEITDSDGLSFSNDERESLSTIEVTNGPNELPEASFNVNATAIFSGDSVGFISSSSDSDGAIVSYIWDFEGDGFFNNEPTTESSVEYTYTAKNQEGYGARLKVIDDKGGESISPTIKIYVDSHAEPPTAAFKYEVLKGSGGMKIKFTNNSVADETAGAKILNQKWDFDTDSQLEIADSDGDGHKDNDIDSQAASPQRLYTETGTYKVKLTITDDQGNVDDVVNQIIIPLANPPIAAFSYQVVDNEVIFQNNSLADSESSATIEEYIWDFDTASALATADSDGDGIKDNDKDDVTANPTFNYEESGTYMVKLTVVDDYGSSDEVVNPVSYTLVPAADNSDDDDDEPASGSSDLHAVLISEPAPNNDDIITLNGETGTIRFNFSQSDGSIAYYIIDKNIYFDSDGNGTKNDDENFKTSLPGTWTTNFDKAWGRTAVKLTITDIYDNSDSTTLEIKFE